MRIGCLILASCLLGLAPRALADEDKKPQPDYPPWNKVGKEMTVVQEGFWNLYQDKKKRHFWVEIPAGHLNKPFLMATSITGGTTLAGYQWNDWLLVWQLNGKKLVLLERNVGYMAKGDKHLQGAIKRTYTDRVLGTYPIRAKGPKNGFVIDGEIFFASGAPLFFGGMGRSKDASLAKFDGTKNFPTNTEVRVTIPRAGSGALITLHYSVSQLKKTDYKPRVADDRVGYFLTVLKDFSPSNKDENRYLRYANRWNLQKADPKLELSPPKEPIVFYIEKTVPLKMRRYVTEGILEWNKAFEKIGFYNAIEVYQQEDGRHAEKDPEDARYNFFRWIYSDMPFAMGPSRVNPETGEILDADILFDDSYVRFTIQEYRLSIKELPVAITGVKGRAMLEKHPLFRLGLVPERDEFLDAIPADAARPNLKPHARRAFCGHGHGVRHQLACCSLLFSGPKPGGSEGADDKLSDEVIGQFVKDTVMHEVGHTLGLRHNFKASVYRTYDEINSESKPADITGSVMDYNPLVIAPDGKPQGYFSMGTIGPYDYWAIEFGYEPDDKKLPKILERVAEKGLEYATDEDTWSDDPYVNRWDMGSDPLNYARERIALMKRLRKNLEERAVDKGERYNRLRRAMNMQLWEARNSGTLALRFIGGEKLHRDHRGDPNARPPLDPVPAAKQREALDFVCDEILSGKYFEFDPDLLRKLAPDFWGDDFFALFFEGHGYPFEENVLRVQSAMIYGLTSPDRLGRVLDMRHKIPADQDHLTVPEIFDSAQRAIFGDVAQAVAKPSTNREPAIGPLRRNLQREWVSQLIEILLEGDYWYPASVQTLVRHYVKTLGEDIASALASAPGLDTYSRAHLEECQARLERALEASYSLVR